MSPHIVTILAAGFGALGAAASLWPWRRMEGTTLRPSLIWSALTFCSVGGAEIFVSIGSLDEPSHLRYAAACLAFCPLMAVLGAKRPQDKAWQFIVFTLWIVLVLPSGEALVDRAEAPLQLHVVRQGFLILLIGLGLLNSFPTRHWISSSLAATGQTLLCSSQLPAGASLTAISPAGAALAGLALLAVASVLQYVELPRRGDSHESMSAGNWDRVWRDFRDNFGTLWTLRVKERFNADAQLCGWPARLDWQGLRQSNESADALQQEAMEQNLRMLLRRFVSTDWIERRLT